MKKILPYMSALIYLLVGQTERAMAQSEEFGTEVLGGLVTASGSRDLFDIVTGIVNTVLYFLGGIAILLALYAGWLWFSSRGNRDQIDKAKKILISATIGLAIIFASYAITNFVIGNLYDNVLRDGSSDDGGGGGGGGYTGIVACPPPTSSGEMSICKYRPSSKPVGGYITISGWNFGDYVDTATSRVSIGGEVASLVSCGTPYWRPQFTRDGNTYYSVKVIVPSVAVGTHSITVANGTRRDEIAGFVVSAGTAGPSIACIEPDSGARGTGVVIKGINFGTTGNRAINMTGWNGTAAAQIDVPFTGWTDTEIRLNIPSNALASYINISNDAFPLDPTDSEYFSVTCDSSCTSVCCSRNECRPANICSGSGGLEFSGPHISYITPDNGQEKSLITIQGSGFGNSVGNGHVEFVDQAGVETRALWPNSNEMNPLCQNLWTDTDIIVGVPTGLSPTENYSVRVYPNNATVPSNSVAFDVNNIARPGICAATPGLGALNTEVTITGVNFIDATENVVKYGGIAGYNTDIDENNDTAISNVPNLRTGLVGIQLNAGTVLSNPYPFNITEALAGDPEIVNITPTAGPVATYVTINGTNFGNTRLSGNVFFGTTPASFDFPLQCSNSIWSNSRIMVKVPDALSSGTSYDIKVVRSDSKESNTKPFAVNTDTLRPGLCAIYPDNGQKNTTQVSFYGDNFGTSAGQIRFYNTQNSPATSWDNNSALYARVPEGAETGPVAVVSIAGVASNEFNFSVGSCSRDSNCPSGQLCCQNAIGNYCAASCTNTRMCTYGWNFSTVPTPATPLEVVDHWPACDSSCGNAQIGVGFNVLLENNTATDVDNYSIVDITNPASPVDVTIDAAILTENPGADVPATVVLDYRGTLELNHTYAVTVSQNIQSEELEVLESPYYWQFTVGQGICEFTGVSITPLNYTARRTGQQVNYSAAPTADVNICGAQILVCNNCNYQWSSSDEDIATIATGNQKVAARTTTNVVPPTGQTSIACAITQSTRSASANTDLLIDYNSYLNGLSVTEHYPDCGNACTNAVIGMHFNTPLDINTVNNTNINIVDTTDSSIVSTVVSSILNDTNNASSESIWAINHNALVTGHRYKVTISTAVKNIHGNSLDQNFEWYFTVGSEECAVTGATVSPATFSANARNQRIGYTVETTSNTISCGNIRVNCRNCSYAWSSNNTAVADITGSRTNKSTTATVAMTAVTGNSVDIQNRVTNGASSFDATPGLLNIRLNLPAYTNPYIESYSPQPPGATAQCRNAAIELVFSEKMNLDSIRNNLKLYNNATGAEIAGTFAFSSVDGLDPDRLNNQTKVVFSPTELLAVSTQYRISLGNGVPPTGIVSANGMPLDLATSPAELQANNWLFTTGDEICKISYLITDPEADWFTCGGNSCEGDQSGDSGNQHKYSVTAYSRQATTLSNAGLNYAWQASPDESNVILSDKTSQEVTAKAGENGKARVSVRVSGTVSGVNLGSATASIAVTVFLCQNPWPSLSAFPWIENLKGLNFSTYYCAKFTDNSPSLPYLSYPPVLSSNTNNLGEYLFTVRVNSATAQNNAFGTLAYTALPNQSGKVTNIWQNISQLTRVPSALGQANGELTRPDYEAPSLSTVGVNGAVVTVNFALPRTRTNIDHFEVQRKLNSASTWSTIQPLPVNSNATSYVDNVDTSGTYNYRVTSVGDDGSSLSSSDSTVEVNVSSASEVNFIAFRVMPNTEHLSVSEWYKSQFPGDTLGKMLTVDGYEAMQVGNTTYISAANLNGNTLYTNIYIISYSLGAHAQTKAIYDQLVANFQLNTNQGFSAHNDDNLCTADAEGNRRACSSDFDCQLGGVCHSKSLKLRRDVKRLTDLLPVKKYLSQYGLAHRACSHNSQISCTQDSQCAPAGTCVSYYPQLNAGTFVPGQTNSKWPSWQQTLASDLRQSLPVDPLNRFSTCAEEGADPETCWNEVTRVFSCLDNSSIYGYMLQDTGKSYTLYSNFEFDPLSQSYPSFEDDLYNSSASRGISALGNISTDLSGYCSDAPSVPGANTCGNGRLNSGEACDGGVSYNQCDARLGERNWWNEQVSGCNPPGTPNQCQWYIPTVTAAMCGGYCGDNSLQSNYESCDLVSGTYRYNAFYSCPSGNASCSSNAGNLTCGAVCSDGQPAARCGDGVWTSGREACDASGNPNGLSGWDCPNNGNVLCTPPTMTSGCGISCDNGQTPYQGRCGDGIVQSPVEQCDYANYATPLPSLATANNRYTCSTSCTFTNPAQPYCGDGIVQYGYRELCDNTLLSPVRPGQSSALNQYQCRMTDHPDLVANPGFTRCTPTDGGYCGDGVVQDGSNGTFNAGEKCDPLGYVVDATHPSSIDHQYVCTDDCQTTGGYCGDGVFNSSKEECDANAGLTGWSCTMGGNLACNNACARTCDVGVPYIGQCGNNEVEGLEQCDGGDVACRSVNASYFGGYTSCVANSCTVASTASCCTTNALSAKFMVDNSFSLYVNGIQIGTGNSWQTCSNGDDPDSPYDAGTLDDNGVCEFNVNNTNLFNYNHVENVLAFKATDTGVAAGVVGTFSCQQTTCQSICFRGSNAGGSCSSDADCPGGGACISPRVPVGTSCLRNNDCNSPEPKASLCLPADYGITTKVNNGLWRCTDTPQSSNAWTQVGFDDRSWESPEAAPHPTNVPPNTSTNWWDTNQVYMWKHMVPGAEPIWLGGVGSESAPRTIYCRYVIRGYGNSLPPVDNENPSAPTNLSVTVFGTQASLTWTAATDNIAVAGYNILRSTTSGGPYTQIDNTLGNITNYTNTGLSNGVTYYYVVQAYDAVGNVSLMSNQQPATVDTQAPSIPAGLNASASGTQITLTWTASTDNVAVTGYDILRSNTSGGPYTNIATELSNSYTNFTLSPGTYYYVVRAKDGAGNISANSAQASATILPPDTTAPSVPNILSATPSNQQVLVTWSISTDPESNPITYTLERATALAGPFTLVANIANNSVADSGLTNGTTYYYRVRASDSYNNISANSAVVSAVPDNNTTAPNAPTALSVVANVVSRVMNLSWTAPVFNGSMVISYIIERSLSADFSSGIVTVGSTVGTSFVDSFSSGGPQLLTNYYYRVKAVGTLLLQSLPSNIASGSFPDTQVPTNPSGLSATATGSQVSLTWIASTDNVAVTGYNILRSTTSGGGYINVGTANTPAHIDSGMPANTYYYVVQAYDSSGNISANSNEAIAVMDNQAPTTPTILSATTSGNQVVITWTSSSDNIAVTGYNVLRSNIDGGPYSKIFSANVTTHTDTGLTTGTYYYVVQAYDAAGNISTNSSQRIITIDAGAPSVPTNLSIVETARGTVSLTWSPSTDPEGNAISYRVYQTIGLPGVGASGLIATVPVTIWGRSGLTPGATYSYRLQAVDSNGNASAYSAYVTITLTL